MSQELKAYEEAWRKEHALRKKADADIDVLNEENLVLRHQIAEARSERDQISQRCKLLQQQKELADIERQASLEKEQRALKQLSRLRTEIQDLEFWRIHFAQVLEAEMQEMDQLASPFETQSDTERQPHELLMGWAKQIGEALRGEDSPDFGNLRRYVLAQWVYLRWLEMHTGVSDGVK